MSAPECPSCRVDMILRWEPLETRLTWQCPRRPACLETAAVEDHLVPEPEPSPSGGHS